ncbi:hypothetical protein WG899_17425 [Paucibacter sp. AS339]|uniref:hypothetical protein n=1 Tax=Paucibacter hankyongi TaxID=3133434 RepID=UPI00309E49D5
MRSNAALLRRLLSEAEASDSLVLPLLEPHPAALIVGLAGTALGLATVRVEGMPFVRELGWLALSLVVAGMLMYVLMQRPGIGWRIGLADARVEPVGQAGAPAVLKGAGWKLLCIAGSKRQSLALEFRHVDGGRPLRVFQTRANAGRAEHALISQLADVMARRLGVERAGLSL